MFLGHYGLGLGAKKIDSRPSLGTLFFASQFIDLLWPVLVLIGAERVIVEPGITLVTPLNFVYYPFSHGLLSVLILGAIVGSVYYFIKKNLKIAVLLSFLVISHWFLDLLVHGPDLPLGPGSEIKLGLGLWNSLFYTLILEGVLFAGGIYLYLRSSRAKNRKGSLGMWGFIVFMLIMYGMNLTGPPPESANIIGLVGLSQWLLVLWGYWFDKNRIPVTKD